MIVDTSVLSRCIELGLLRPIVAVWVITMDDSSDAKAKARRYVAAAVLDLKGNDLDGAIGKLDVALDADPANADAYRHRGITYAKRRDFNMAIADFDQAARLKPQDADIYYFRGLVWQHKGQRKRAIEDYDRALALNPDHAKAREKRLAAQEVVGQAVPQAQQAAADSKNRVPCPFCRELVIFGAIKCRHCGSSISQAATPTSQSMAAQNVGANSMSFGLAIKTCLGKYATFQGRASRAEYWYFMLFCGLLNISITILAAVVFGEKMSNWAHWVLFFLFLLPQLSALARRLHDVNRSGWWQLLSLTVIGAFPLLYWILQKGDNGPNRYGRTAGEEAYG